MFMLKVIRNLLIIVILFGIGIIISNILNKVIKSELSKSSYNLDKEENGNNSTPEIINSEIVEEFLEI